MELTTDFLVFVSILVASVSLFIIFLCIVILFVLNRKSEEQKKAERVLAKVYSSKFVSQKEKADVSTLQISKGEVSLKNLLIKKFKPKIESQLGTKIEVIDFNAKGNSFLALVDISDVRVILSLDSAGKIIDYKKVKRS
jgi:hypothetical protein